MARMRNDAAEIPAHMRAVLYRQYARDAEYSAHKSPTLDTRQSYRCLAELWRILAEEMDAERDAASPRTMVQPLHFRDRVRQS